ncbi:hypothetical protein HAL_33060 [Haladaptatus sp. T7]|nr:hypothetical protein HAL_33060 [Haladaptatus sp. T7]
MIAEQITGLSTNTMAASGTRLWSVQVSIQLRTWKIVIRRESRWDEFLTPRESKGLLSTMPHRDSDYTPLSPMATEALTHLRTRFGSSESFTYEQAGRVLREHDIESVLVDDLLETLLLRGYLYEVGDNLRITD